MYHFEEKVKYLVQLRNMSITEFAEAMGMHRAAVYELIKRPVIKPEIIAKICHILKVDVSFFENKEKYPKIQEPGPDLSEPTPPTRGNIIYVPLVAYGGFLHGYASKVYMDSLQRFSMPGIQGEHYAFEVDGISMYPWAAPGDHVIARPEEKLEYMMRGKQYVLQTTDGILVKTFDELTDHSAQFSSFNKDYQPIMLPLKSIKRVYFVALVVKKNTR